MNTCYIAHVYLNTMKTSKPTLPPSNTILHYSSLHLITRYYNIIHKMCLYQLLSTASEYVYCTSTPTVHMNSLTNIQYKHTPNQLLE